MQILKTAVERDAERLMRHALSVAIGCTPAEMDAITADAGTVISCSRRGALSSSVNYNTPGIVEVVAEVRLTIVRKGEEES